MVTWPSSVGPARAIQRDLSNGKMTFTLHSRVPQTGSSNTCRGRSCSAGCYPRPFAAATLNSASFTMRERSESGASNTSNVAVRLAADRLPANFTMRQRSESAASNTAVRLAADYLPAERQAAEPHGEVVRAGGQWTERDWLRLSADFAAEHAGGAGRIQEPNWGSVYRSLHAARTPPSTRRVTLDRGLEGGEDVVREGGN